jgi:circadian clock protein KaiB
VRKKDDNAAGLTRAAKARKNARYELKLYVAGFTGKSATAIRSATPICEEHLRNRYELEVIDLYQRPTLARGEQIVAAPTLIKKLPRPWRKLIGDMGNADRVLVGPDLRPKP